MPRPSTRIVTLAVLTILATVPTVGPTARGQVPDDGAPPSMPSSISERDITRCAAYVVRALRPIARVEVRAAARDAVIFDLIARGPCSAWGSELRALARLVRRGSDRADAELRARLVDAADPACNVDASRLTDCRPHHVEVRGVVTQALAGSEGYARLVLVRAVDALGAEARLVPIAQLLWGFGDYAGGCESWDIAWMHDDVRRGLVRQVPYRPRPGHTREELAAR
jgi:hypothetical protein